MDLRHRHGDAAADAGHGEQRCRRVGRQAERARASAAPPLAARGMRGPASAAAASGQRAASPTRQTPRRPVGGAPAIVRGSAGRRSSARPRRRCSCPRRRWPWRAPRRLANQCEMSATSGMKVAAEPKPIRAWAAANSVSEGASGASAKPPAISRARQRRWSTNDAARVDQPAEQDAAGAEAQHGQWCRRRRCRRA